MKKIVRLSTWCSVMTSLGLLLLLAALYNAKQPAPAYMVAAALIIICSVALFYMPLSISVKNGFLNINRPLKIKSIPIDQIKSAAPCPKTIYGRRICGSGGWFGYYGWFSAPAIGRYFAYYGKRSDRFLLSLKDGKKYILGCDSPEEMVAYINNQIA